MIHYDVIIIGAGAAGLMCAIEAGKRGRKVLVLERSEKVGSKILISGGGRCNFTNLFVAPECYISSNKHFAKSALARFDPSDFLSLIEKHKIPYHEKKLGQLFCDGSAREIVTMLLAECESVGVVIERNVHVASFSKAEAFSVVAETKTFTSQSLVIATGGRSIPKMGATDFGYRVAEQFGLTCVPCAPGLVPFTFSDELLSLFSEISGVALDVEICCNDTSFREQLLFTHRGLSGPAILQISSYWNPGEALTLNLLPDTDLDTILDSHKDSPRMLKTVLLDYFPKRFLQVAFAHWVQDMPLVQIGSKEREALKSFFHSWTLTPGGTEGYRKAEVTLGGVNVDELSSQTFEAKKVSGLYFIGEVLDVTGWLGGYNFQWAWASGYCAGQYV
ncbi:MAG: NAD(P)/FAD-dependent oxidoreductase [Bdellovibrionales bacterium]|nr:NAD(P)/FAD-dependent oxidoreductase [Bdellovibrionales bacterium]